MAIEREVRWNSPASLRVIEAEGADIALRGVLPTVPAAQGTLAEMVRLVMAEPAERRWRYTIVSELLPLLGGEEIGGLAELPDFAAA